MLRAGLYEESCRTSKMERSCFILGVSQSVNTPLMWSTMSLPSTFSIMELGVLITVTVD